MKYIFLFLILATYCAQNLCAQNLFWEDYYQSQADQTTQIPNNAFEHFQVNGIRNGQTIVLVDQNFALGDSVIYHQRKLASLHQKFPDSKIVFISPFTNIVPDHPWLIKEKLDPVNMRVHGADALHAKTIEKAQKLNELTEKYSSENTYWIIDHLRQFLDDLQKQAQDLKTGPNTTPLSSSLAEKIIAIHKQSTSIYQSLITNLSQRKVPYIMFDFANSNYEDNKIFSGDTKLDSGEYVNQSMTHKNKFTGQDVYSHAEIIENRMIGIDSRLADIQDFFTPPSAAISKYEKWLINRQLNGKATIIVNLSSGGLEKVSAGQDLYIPTLKSIINKLNAEFPEHKILINTLEPHYPAKLQHKFEQFLDSREGKSIQLMPVQKNLWGAMIVQSEFVVSTDSGFVHVANSIKGADKVFTFSVNGASDVTFWRQTNQAATNINTQKPLVEQESFVRWLKQQKPCQRGFARILNFL